MLSLTYSYSTSLRLLVALSFLTSSIGIASAASIPTNSSATRMNVTPPAPSDSLSLTPASRHQQDDDKGTPIRLVAALHFEPPRDDHSHNAESTSGVCMIIGNHAIAWDHTAVPKDYKLHLSELEKYRHFGYYSTIGDIDLYTHTMENFPKGILEEIESQARKSQQKAEDSDLLTEGFDHLDNFMNLLISGRYHVNVTDKALESYKLLMSMYRTIAKPEIQINSQYLGLVADIVFNAHPYRSNRKVSKDVDMTIGERTIPAPPPSSSTSSRSSNLRIGSYNSAGYGRKRLGFIHFYGNPEAILTQVEKITPEIESRDRRNAKMEFLEDFMCILGVSRDVTVFEVVVQQWVVAAANYRQALNTWRMNQRDRDAVRRNRRPGHRTIH
ncbi:hypothetical protein F5878DRAFT_659671 [Lentinula raphanica]|uniref:Uncharacterized protein n=1 Tax=Lentinula raphanica TaxID=153919 RepID=A0AA38PC25_9AGAR|nr:hypothetical protein F5878DRAFT_659671 [Lentinula raphanica]